MFLILFVHMTSTLDLLELFVHMTSTRDINLLSDCFRMLFPTLSINQDTTDITYSLINIKCEEVYISGPIFT